MPVSENMPYTKMNVRISLRMPQTLRDRINQVGHSLGLSNEKEAIRFFIIRGMEVVLAGQSAKHNVDAMEKVQHLFSEMTEELEKAGKGDE